MTVPLARPVQVAPHGPGQVLIRQLLRDYFSPGRRLLDTGENSPVGTGGTVVPRTQPRYGELASASLAGLDGDWAVPEAAHRRRPRSLCDGDHAGTAGAPLSCGNIRVLSATRIPTANLFTHPSSQERDIHYRVS